MGCHHNLNPEVLYGPYQELTESLLQIGVKMLIRLVDQEDWGGSTLKGPESGLEHHIKADRKVLCLPTAKVLHTLDEFASGDFHTGFLDEVLTASRLEELHGEQNPFVEEVAVMAAACLATLSARRLPDDPFAHAADSGWWDEGLRTQHGRFPR